MNQTQGGSAARLATGTILLAGVVLRIVQWAGNPSLWNDELLIVSNVRGRGLGALLAEPLELGQVAPVGFLVLEKITTAVLGDSEQAFRLVPLLASLLALLLFAHLARRLLGPTGAFVATAAFSLNPMLVSLGGLAKHYAFDVLSTVLLLVVLRRLLAEEGSLRSRMLLGFGADLVGFLSITSVMVAAAAILALAYWSWRSAGPVDLALRPTTVLPGVVWGAVALAAALWARALLSQGTGGIMADFWSAGDAFAPPLTGYPTWALERFGNTILPGFLFRPYFGRPSAFEPVYSLVGGSVLLLGAAGLVALIALARVLGAEWTIAVVCTFGLALGFSRYSVYPLATRTSVYLLPFMLLSIGSMAELARRAFRASNPRAAVVIGVLALGLPIAVLVEHPPVYGVQPTREMIGGISDRVPSGEPVVADPWARWALDYYGPRFQIPDQVHFQESALNGAWDPSQRLADLDGFKGESSVWVLFTLPEGRAPILCYLDEIGIELESLVLSYGELMPPSSLHRYDLSDETRWDAARSAGFPLTADAFEGPSPRCPERPLQTTVISGWARSD